MKRNINDLTNQKFDILVIGGGIYGACVARDAAMRGLSVALVEKADFGGATSANSLKTIHGGLRYLQDGNLKLIRTMINERKAWLRIAPHLVQPLTCVLPTYQTLTKNRWALSCALKINDLVGFDRNRNLQSHQHLANGRTISQAECLAKLPELAPNNITGAAVWSDAQMYNSERLLISILRSATTHGATIANYVEVKHFLRNDDSVYGVIAQDLLSKETVSIQAQVVINCTGPWTDKVLEQLEISPQSRRFHLSTAINLVVRQIRPGMAVGFLSHYQDNTNKQSQPRSRVLFAAPWRQYTLIGTFHAPYYGRPEDFTVTERHVQCYLDEINGAMPGANLKLDDVFQVHRGFLPAVAGHQANGAVKLIRQSRIHDHAREDGVRSLITVVGVKYTTARHVAQQAVDLALKKLAVGPIACRTADIPIFGGDIVDFLDFQSGAYRRLQPEYEPAVIQQLVYNYGTEYNRILYYIDLDPTLGQLVGQDVPVLKAEVIYAVREEMAQRLVDVVQRRTELGSVGPPQEDTLRNAATVMGQAMGWNSVRVAEELISVQQIYNPTTWLGVQEQQI